MSSTVVAGDIVSDPIRRTRSLCQGGPDAPKVFNLVLDQDLINFNEQCGRKRWGVDIDGQLVGVICFADNFWIMATSSQMLQEMVRLSWAC